MLSLCLGLNQLIALVLVDPSSGFGIVVVFMLRLMRGGVVRGLSNLFLTYGLASFSDNDYVPRFISLTFSLS